MKLVGVTNLVSKKSGSALMKLSMLDDTPRPNRVGSDVSTEFVPYNEDYLGLVGCDIQIFYRKSYDGKALFDYLSVIEEGGSKK